MRTGIPYIGYIMTKTDLDISVSNWSMNWGSNLHYSLARKIRKYPMSLMGLNICYSGSRGRPCDFR